MNLGRFWREDLVTRKTVTACVLMLVLCLSAFAAEISFSGGFTKVTMQEGERRVLLSEGATINTQDLELEAEEVEIYGKNYSNVLCTGNVCVTVSDRGISLQTPSLFYDRDKALMSTDSWIEIQDEENQAALSGSWFEYDMDNEILKLQVMARIIKITDDGPMTCRADSIELDNKTHMVTLKGNATISWNNDTYKASVIVVDLQTNDISMYGSISGEVNG